MLVLENGIIQTVPHVLSSRFLQSGLMPVAHCSAVCPRSWRLFGFSRKNRTQEGTKENTTDKEVTRPAAVSATALEDGPKISQTFDRLATTFSAALANLKSPIHTRHSEQQRLTNAMPEFTNRSVQYHRAAPLTVKFASNNNTLKIKGHKNVSRKGVARIPLIQTGIPTDRKIPYGVYQVWMEILPEKSSKYDANELAGGYVEKKEKWINICSTVQLPADIHVWSTESESNSCYEANKYDELQQICNLGEQHKLCSIRKSHFFSLHGEQLPNGKDSSKNRLITGTRICKRCKDSKKMFINFVKRCRIKNAGVLRMGRDRRKENEIIKFKTAISKPKKFCEHEAHIIAQLIFSTKNISYKQACNQAHEEKCVQNYYQQRKFFPLQNERSFSAVSYYKPPAIGRKIIVKELMHRYRNDTGLCVRLKRDSGLTYWNLKGNQQNYSTRGSTSGEYLSPNEISSYSRKLQKYCTNRKMTQDSKSEKDDCKEEYETDEPPQDRIKRELKEVEECKKVERDQNKTE